MRKVALYARVSSAEQARPDATSIEKQITAGRKDVERMISFGTEAEVVAEYRDEGISGAVSFEDRPTGFKLLTDAKRGVFDTVIFYSLDRFTRNATKGLNDFELMEDALGLTLVFAKESIDTSQPSGKLFRTILAAFSEFERDTIRDRNMAGRYGKAKRGGGWATGQPPFGYEIGPEGHLIIKEDEAEIVRRIFTMRANGQSLPSIARALNELGLKPRDRHDRKTGEVIPASFTAGAISGYLKAEWYKGVPIRRLIAPSKSAPTEEFEFPVSEIVTDRLWDSAQAASAALSPIQAAGTRIHNYALSGRMYHAHEGGGDSIATVYGQGRATRSGDHLRFYRCSAARRNTSTGQAPYCTGMGEAFGQQLSAVQSDWIEGHTLLWVLDMLSHPEAISKLTDPKADTNLGDEGYEEIKDRQNQLKARLDRWAEQYAEGIIDKATRDERMGTIAVELEGIEAQLASLQHKAASKAELNVTIKQLMEARVADVGDPSGGEDNVPEMGSEAWWTEARISATNSTKVGKYNRSPVLPSWLVEDLKFLATRLDIEVYIYRAKPGDDRPEFYIGFEGTRALQPKGPRPNGRRPESMNTVRESQETHEVVQTVTGYEITRTGRPTPPLPIVPGRAYFVSGTSQIELTNP